MHLLMSLSDRNVSLGALQRMTMLLQTPIGLDRNLGDGLHTIEANRHTCCDCSEAFLAGRVPDGKLYLLAIQFHCPCFEINAEM